MFILALSSKHDYLSFFVTLLFVSYRMVPDPRIRFENMREEARQAMQGLHRLNPEKLDFYINYLKFQVEHGFYDVDANLNILKLYQFSPNLITRDTAGIVHQILVKALMQLPKPDYVLCRAQLSQDLIDDPLTKKIDAVATLLETCQFAELWTTVDQEKIFEMKGFRECVRNFVVHVIKLTYKNIEKDFLLQMLGPLDPNESIDQILEENNWVIDGNGVFIGHKEEMAESKEIVEKMSIDVVQPLLAIR